MFDQTPNRPEPASDLPTLEPGVTVLRPPAPRSTALHRLVADALLGESGPVYWVDARNAANTHALYDAAPSRRSLAGLMVARAFTAYQHHELVRGLPRNARPGTRLVVVPNAAALYRDGDVPGAEAARLLDASLSVLTELADALDCPVLLTATGDDERAERVVDAADVVVDCERTRLGLTFDAPGFTHSGYYRDGYWQTTVPYWVDLLGRVVLRDPEVATEVHA
ncbi:hypothetical protein HUG10_01305 [Halorarum halophilum]|uniref:Uncharacterized protein n=1 Tax=Halorarum halophilum TaxID=2743090 RepID=A0A7D5KW90_9EURY|nr:hypothetical protein [Halobaculum halophilum]QLG26258.1 hypothetical protein HUG10_01305 [Halobaculum halophilum]